MELLTRFQRKAQNCIDDYNERYGTDVPYPTVYLNLKGVRCYGTADYKKLMIRMHKRYCEDYFEDAFNDTLPHEVAHIIVGHLFPSARPHGKEWKRVCKFLGCTPKRASKDISLRQYKKEHFYSCGCQSFTLSDRNHNKFLRGEVYRCVHCFNWMKPVDMSEQEVEVIAKKALEKRKHEYQCACRYHYVTPLKHKRILEGTWYRCFVCYAVLSTDRYLI